MAAVCGVSLLRQDLLAPEQIDPAGFAAENEVVVVVIDGGGAGAVAVEAMIESLVGEVFDTHAEGVEIAVDETHEGKSFELERVEGG